MYPITLYNGGEASLLDQSFLFLFTIHEGSQLMNRPNHLATMIAFVLVILATATAVACTSSGPTEPIYEEISAGTLTSGQDLPTPTGDVLLTVGGDISHTNTAEGTAQFDLEMLESMRQVQYDVTDPFVEEKRLFQGILLRDLLDLVGASDNATTLDLVALNGYSAEMKLSDTQDFPMLFSLKADGEYMPLDEGGPAIIIIPYDDYPDQLDHITYDAQWVWSMTEINVR